MNAKSILERIFALKLQLDVADPEDCAYIQRQIDEQIDSLQCIVKEPKEVIRRVIDSRYPDWLDGKALPEEGDSP